MNTTLYNRSITEQRNRIYFLGNGVARIRWGVSLEQQWED